MSKVLYLDLYYGIHKGVINELIEKDLREPMTLASG